MEGVCHHIFLSFLKIQNFVEIHQEFKGFTLILFNLKKLIWHKISKIYLHSQKSHSLLLC